MLIYTIKKQKIIISTMKNPEHKILAVIIAEKLFPRVVGLITANEIVLRINAILDKINRKHGTNFKKGVSTVHVRDIINYIRDHNLCPAGEILACSKGYYVSTWQDEIEEYGYGWLRRLDSQYRPANKMIARAKNYPRKPLAVVLQKPIDGDLFDAL